MLRPVSYMKPSCAWARASPRCAAATISGAGLVTRTDRYAQPESSAPLAGTPARRAKANAIVAVLMGGIPLRRSLSRMPHRPPKARGGKLSFSAKLLPRGHAIDVFVPIPQRFVEQSPPRWVGPSNLKTAADCGTSEFNSACARAVPGGAAGDCASCRGHADGRCLTFAAHRLAIDRARVATPRTQRRLHAVPDLRMAVGMAAPHRRARGCAAGDHCGTARC